MIYPSILKTVGNTPSVRINNLAPEGINLYVKAEFFNPASSVKDRLALSIINEAEKQGILKPGQTVVEATSGNLVSGWHLFVLLKTIHALLLCQKAHQ
jgi:cysteine synthase A